MARYKSSGSQTLTSQAALIQHEHSNTVALYKELATIKAKDMKRARVALISE